MRVIRLKVKIFAFDLMGTLLNVDSIPISNKVVSKRRKEFLELWRRKQLEYTWRSDIMGLNLNFWEITKKSLLYTARYYDIELSSSQIEETMEGWLHLSLHDNVKTSLSELKSKKVILTNADQEMAKRMIENSQLTGLIENLFTADAVGKFKPSREVYNTVPRFYNVTPSEICLISSNAWDVDGAISAGLQAAYLKRKGQSPEALTGKEPPIINDLGELINIFV